MNRQRRKSALLGGTNIKRNARMPRCNQTCRRSAARANLFTLGAAVALVVTCVNGVEAQQDALGAGGAPQFADQSPDAQSELRARVERLERQNQELLQSLQRLQAEPASQSASAVGVSSVQGLPPAPSDPSRAPSKNLFDEPASWTPATPQPNPDRPQSAGGAGGNLGASVNFRDGFYLWIESPNKDFTMHLGGWMQIDNVFWDQSTALKTPPGARPGPAQGVASGVADGGIGDLQNGEFFRRIRPFAEGTFWGNGEYRLILALENDQFNSSGLDEFWVAVNNLPIFGSLRVGHVKDAVGLEGDMTSSSRTMTFMERSSYSEAIELNQNFVTGVWLGNSYLDKRVSYQAVAFRSDQGVSSGAFFGDGQWGLQGRLTGLPIYEQDGRHLLHLGVSGGWRSGTNNIANSRFFTDRLSARPELRDDLPDGSPSGAQVVPNANSNRMVDTAAIAAGADFLMGTELLYIRGPFSLQAEYGWNWMTDVVGVAPTGATLNPPINPSQDYVFSGGYVQVAYTLTGENRAYDRNIGTLARQYYGRSGPYSNALSFRDSDGNFCWSSGAWELAARYSHVNLNDGTGLNRIQGGAMDGVALAVNWYLNSNMNVMFDWVYDHRYHVPVDTIPGYTSGFGTEVQFQF